MADHPDKQVGERDKGVPWYTKDEELQDLSPSTKELLQSYSGISEDQILPHIYKVVSYRHILLVLMRSRLR